MPENVTKHIYFVRHGQTHANFDDVVPSREATLHPNGFIQAEQLATRLKNIKIDTVIASDFIRAQQSAEPLLKSTGLQLEVHPEFGEYVEPAKYFGLDDNGAEVVAYRNQRNSLVDTDPKWTEADEESLQAFFDRQLQAKAILEQHESENIVIVSHGFFLMCFMSLVVLGADKPSSQWLQTARRFKFSNMGVSVVTINEGQWRFITVNDHAHFAE